MKRIFRNGMIVVALLASACMKDGPVSPDARRVSVHVQFQTSAGGSAVQISIMSIIADSEQVSDTLFNGTFPVTTGAQQVTASFDLTRCLARQRPDATGPFCTVEVELALLDNGVVVDQQFLGVMDIRPGQQLQTQPVVLVAGNNPPVITATDTAREVEQGLLRYHIAASDPDGDITSFGAIDLLDGSPDRVLDLEFYPPLRTVDATYYAFKSPLSSPTAVRTFFSDSRFNTSAIVDIPVGFAIGDAAVDSMSVDTTADSLIVGAIATSDSLEVVVRNLDDGRTDSLYFVCGANEPLSGTGPGRRIACARTVPFTQALVIVLPVDAAGNAGTGFRCAVGDNPCLFQPGFDRVPRRRK